MGAYVDHLVRRLMGSRQRFQMERKAVLVLMKGHMLVNLVCAVWMPVPVSYRTSEPYISSLQGSTLWQLVQPPWSMFVSAFSWIRAELSHWLNVQTVEQQPCLLCLCYGDGELGSLSSSSSLEEKVPGPELLDTVGIYKIPWCTEPQKPLLWSERAGSI